MLEKKRHRRRWLKASNRWSVTFKIWSLNIPLKYLVGTYLQPLQAQWFIALPSYISKSDLIADLENFIQTGVLCACCWMSDSRLLELELAQVVRLKLLLAWFGFLLWKESWLSRLAVAWECVLCRVCFLSFTSNNFYYSVLFIRT